MKKEELYTILIPKERDLENLAKKAENNEQIIQLLIEELKNSEARIKYGSLNTLVLISEKSPKSLYPFFDFFVKLLNSEKNVFKLGAIKIICNLSLVDEKKHIETHFKKLYSFISEKKLTPAANIVKGSSIVLKSKPELADKIISKLLQIRTNEYETKECKEILRGQTIDLFYKYFEKLPQKEKIKTFVRESLNSNRNSTRKKAEKFMKKYK